MEYRSGPFGLAIPAHLFALDREFLPRHMRRNWRAEQRGHRRDVLGSGVVLKRICRSPLTGMPSRVVSAKETIISSIIIVVIWLTGRIMLLHKKQMRR